MLGTPSTEPNEFGGVNLGKLIEVNVAGNLDESVLPQIEDIAARAVEMINQAMQRRGSTRNANTFSI